MLNGLMLDLIKDLIKDVIFCSLFSSHELLHRKKLTLFIISKDMTVLRESVAIWKDQTLFVSSL